MSDSLKYLYQLSLLQFDSFPVQNEHTTVSPGLSAWRATPARKQLQISRSRSLGYQMPLPLPSVSTSPECGSTSASVKQKVFVLLFFHPFFALWLLCCSVSLT